MKKPLDEEAILAWYEAHQGDFMSQEMVMIEYLELDAATMGGAVEPEEELLQGRFEEQKSRLSRRKPGWHLTS